MLSCLHLLEKFQILLRASVAKRGVNLTETQPSEASQPECFQASGSRKIVRTTATVLLHLSGSQLAALSDTLSRLCWDLFRSLRIHICLALLDQVNRKVVHLLKVITSAQHGIAWHGPWKQLKAR